VERKIKYGVNTMAVRKSKMATKRKMSKGGKKRRMSKGGRKK